MQMMIICLSKMDFLLFTGAVHSSTGSVVSMHGMIVNDEIKTTGKEAIVAYFTVLSQRENPQLALHLSWPRYELGTF
jgi:hypothetical protein